MAEVNQQQVIDYIKGISVLELSQLVKALEKRSGRRLYPTLLFEVPTIEALAASPDPQLSYSVLAGNTSLTPEAFEHVEAAQAMSGNGVGQTGTQHDELMLAFALNRVGQHYDIDPADYELL